VVDGAGGDDGALALHESRAGGHGADGAGVGEGDGGAGEIGGGEFGGAGAGDEVVKGGDVFLEIEIAGVLDVGHHEGARAIFSGDIDCDAEVDFGVDDADGLAVLFGEGVIDAGIVFQGADDGPSEEVGVGDLAAADESAVLVDDASVF